MSNFEITKIDNENLSSSHSNFLVKPKDPRWQNFPPCFVPKPFLKTLEKVKSFTVYDDDIFLTGYPRSGTTIVAEMIWLMANNFDFEKAKVLVTDDRVPGLE